MDQSFQDASKNSAASLTLSEASLTQQCVGDENLQQACDVSLIQSQDAIGGDPENPMCARLTITGKLVELTSAFESIQSSFFQRHPQMQTWPENHNWKILKLEIEELWLIDHFGGATIMTPETYYAANISLQVDSFQ